MDRQHQGHAAAVGPRRGGAPGPGQFPRDDLTKDWTQSDNVAHNLLNEWGNEALFWLEADKYQVEPLDASVATRLV